MFVCSSYTLVEGNGRGVSTQEFLLIEHFFMHNSITSEWRGMLYLFPTWAVKKTRAFSWNVSKLFSELKLGTDDIPFHFMQEPIEKPRKVYAYSFVYSCSLVLVRETVLLIHKVSIHDRFFDTHRENCDHAFVSVLNTLSWLLQEIPCIHEGTQVAGPCRI